MYCCFSLKKFLPCLCAALILATGVVCLAVNAFIYEAVSANADSGEEIFVPIIMYHSLLKNPDRAGDYVVSPNVFESDMRYLSENGYTTVFVSDLINYVDNGAPLPKKPVVVTFDDGYYNIMEYAYPYMKENNIKGVINIVGSYAELSTEEDEHNPAYSYLTWEEIAALEQSGIFEVGSHSYDMHSLNGGRRGCKKIYGESPENYRNALFNDIGALQNMLEDKSGVTAVTFAYPYGFISEESVPVLREIGFKALLTCYEKPNYISRENPECLLCLNRYNRPSGISSEDFFKKVLCE